MPKIAETLKEERRGAILHAAVDSLVERGYSQTSMRTIAEAAGMTKGALYAYYPNKEAILLAVAEHYMSRQLEHLAPQRHTRARAQLDALFASYRHASADPQMIRAQRAILDLFTVATDLPAVREALDERYRCYVGAVASVIRRAQDEGSIGLRADPELIAGLILAARDGMVLERVKLGAPVPVLELTQLLQDVVVGDAAERHDAGGVA